VLIIALAVSKPWGFHWGLGALLAMTLSWHEPGAVRLLWLCLIAAARLLGVAPGGGKLATAIKVFRAVGLVVALGWLVPFVIDEARQALHPLLDVSKRAPCQSNDRSLRG
jgi:hypothetical protein